MGGCSPMSSGCAGSPEAIACASTAMASTKSAGLEWHRLRQNYKEVATSTMGAATWAPACRGKEVAQRRPLRRLGPR